MNRMQLARWNYICKVVSKVEAYLDKGYTIYDECNQKIVGVFKDEEFIQFYFSLNSSLFIPKVECGEKPISFWKEYFSSWKVIVTTRKLV